MSPTNTQSTLQETKIYIYLQLIFFQLVRFVQNFVCRLKALKRMYTEFGPLRVEIKHIQGSSREPHFFHQILGRKNKNQEIVPRPKPIEI